MKTNKELIDISKEMFARFGRLYYCQSKICGCMGCVPKVLVLLSTNFKS